ncbi:hypothetical protein GALMADRAFT_152645 [Galerina marginata CBS 339.88]|uniref:Enoyl reductase (ER) domain-containing protein n=1 Tax=Galerina marginata (strain CBS 339.88) TaxID=685588 RepID=A0A067THK4_GALM3|nr:hypothetical protein GALMADRAFT_152645 [Galerina marginata CBS 339.88]
MTTAIPNVQRAWVNVSRGAPNKALVFKEDWPVTKNLGPGEVLVQVQAAALNPVGYKLMKVLPNFIAGRPRVPEFDLSGVIVDANNTRFSNGDQVYGWVPSNLLRKTNQGSLAQYAKVPADALVIRPPSVTPVQASGFTLAGLTAYDAIIKKANIQSGQTIFIHGGSTSVGAFAIQLAKIRGARVTACASGKNENFVRGIGADEFVDYTKVSLPQYLAENNSTTKFDYIFEAVGINDPSLYTCSDSYLSPTGAFLSVGPQPKDMSLSEIYSFVKSVSAMFTPKLIGGAKARFINVMVINDIKDAEQFQRYVAEGSLKPIVDSVFDFDQALKAYDRLISGRATGKVVVKVDPSIE